MTEFDLHFMRPLWLLSLLPLAVLLWRLVRSDGDGDVWRAVVDAHLLPGLLTDGAGSVHRLPLVLLGLGWLLIVLALAGPVWERLPETMYQARQFRVVVLDLSPSMNATDLAPSRLARARYEVLDLLRQSDEGQTALLAYGAEPYIVSPLTTDVETIAAQVPSLETSLLPVSGARRTDLALDEAAELLRQAGAPDGQVILVTDSLGAAAAASEAARRLQAAGYSVSVLGLGTAEGAPVPLPGGGYLKDDAGAIRIPKLDVAGLQALAAAGGGRYVTADFSDRDIQALKPGGATASAEETEDQHTQADRWREEGPWLLLVLLPIGALAFRRGWLSPLLVLVCLVPPPDAHAFSWEGLWQRPDQQATRLLENGRSDEAAEIFQRPDWRAAAQYQASDYEQALQSLQGLDGSDTEYNLGNTLARLGRLEEAVAAYDRRLGVAPDDADARHNRQLVQQLIEQSRQPQQQSDQQSQQDEQQQQSDQQSQQDEQQQQSDQQSQQDEQQNGEKQAEQQQSGGQGAEDEQPDAQQVDAQGSEGEQQQERDSAGQGSEDAQQAKGQESADGQQQAKSSGEQGAQSGQQDPQQANGQGPEGEQHPQQSAGEQESPSAEQDPRQADEQESQSAQQQTQASDGQDSESGQLRSQRSDAQESGNGQQAAQSTSGEGPEEGKQAQQAGNTGPADQGRQAQGQPPGQTGDTERRSRQASDPASNEPGLADLLGAGSSGSAAAKVTDAAAGIDLEDRQAIEQMLRRVEDDPAGLLRQRFLLQHLRRTGQLP